MTDREIISVISFNWQIISKKIYWLHYNNNNNNFIVQPHTYNGFNKWIHKHYYIVTIINTVKAISFQVGKRHLCIKIAVFRISIGSLFDIKKAYLSLAFQYLSDLCLTNLKD